MKYKNTRIGASARSHIHAQQQQSHDKREAERGNKRGDDVSVCVMESQRAKGMNCSGKEKPRRGESTGLRNAELSSDGSTLGRWSREDMNRETRREQVRQWGNSESSSSCG